MKPNIEHRTRMGSGCSSRSQERSGRLPAGLVCNAATAKVFRRAAAAQSLTSSALEQTNPLRNLTLARAVALMEATLRGEFTQAAWTLWHVEQTDADLFALISRRQAALLEMDWNIKQVSGLDEKLAGDQAAALRAAYERLDNLSEAVADLAKAFCRGYSILQFESGLSGVPTETSHLGAYQPWNILRDGLQGDFYFNPEARAVSARSLPPENRIDPANHLIYTPSANLARIALYKFVRMNLSQKDWDAFIEIYGLPSAFIIGPPNVSAENEPRFRDSALDAQAGGGGYLPHGSDIKFADSPRGVSPFRSHLDYLQQQLILAGTGGLLTMLTQPTGIGQGASLAHEDTFKTIARGEARKISEVFQRQFDKRILEAAFPGRPALAYFELAANEEREVGEIIDHALKLSQAGYEIDPAELSEKTGYTLTLKPAGGPLALNRRATRANADPPPDAAPAGRALNSAADISDLAPADLAAALDRAAREIAAPDAADLADDLERGLAAGLLKGIKDALAQP